MGGRINGDDDDATVQAPRPPVPDVPAVFENRNRPLARSAGHEGHREAASLPFRGTLPGARSGPGQSVHGVLMVLRQYQWEPAAGFEETVSRIKNALAYNKETGEGNHAETTSHEPPPQWMGETTVIMAAEEGDHAETANTLIAAIRPGRKEALRGGAIADGIDLFLDDACELVVVLARPEVEAEAAKRVYHPLRNFLTFVHKTQAQQKEYKLIGDEIKELPPGLRQESDRMVQQVRDLAERLGGRPAAAAAASARSADPPDGSLSALPGVGGPRAEDADVARGQPPQFAGSIEGCRPGAGRRRPGEAGEPGGPRHRPDRGRHGLCPALRRGGGPDRPGPPEQRPHGAEPVRVAGQCPA